MRFSVFLFTAVLLISLSSLVQAFADHPRAFFGKPDVYDISLSPDGKSVAFLTNEAAHGISVSAIWDRLDIRSTETGDDIYKGRDTERFYNWISWVFDDILIAQTVQWDVPKGRYIGYETAIKAIDPKTGTERNVWLAEWERRGKNIVTPTLVDFSRTRREIVIKLERNDAFDLIAVNVDTGAQRRLDRGSKRTVAWKLDKDLVPYLRLDEGRRDNQELLYRRDDEGNWKLVRIYNPLENDFYPVSVMDDNSSMLVIHRPEKAEFAGLYRYNLLTDAYESLEFQVEGHDLAGFSSASFSGEPLYVSWYEDNQQKHWLSDEYKTLASQIDGALEADDNWRVAETSLDGKHWLLYISSPRRAGRYFYMNLETKRIIPVVKTRTDIKPEHLSAMKKVDYKAQDGTELFGYFIQGKGTSGSPLIVLPHGGPVSRDTPDYDGLAQFLAYRGYNVFQPQFRGGGGLGRSFEAAGFGEWGRKMQTDIEDGVAALISQKLIASNARRSILGASYGGYAAMAAATLTPDKYQCVFSINGVSDLQLMLESYDQTDVLDKYLYDIWTTRIGDPATELDKIKSVSPYHLLDRVKAPVFLIHGTNDNIVSVEQSRRTRDRMLELGKRVSYHELEGADHSMTRDEHRAELLVILDRFLTSCMPAR